MNDSTTSQTEETNNTDITNTTSTNCTVNYGQHRLHHQNVKTLNTTSCISLNSTDKENDVAREMS